MTTSIRGSTTIYGTKRKPSTAFVAAATLQDEIMDTPNNNNSNNNDDDPLARTKQRVLDALGAVADEAKEYAASFGFTPTEAAIYAIFAAIRKSQIPLGLGGTPFLLRRDDILGALETWFVQEGNPPPFDHFFTMRDLAKAVEDDFLDAARGYSENRQGWKITSVSTPRGDSFEEARMTFQDVQNALGKGTVILNAIGAHVPKLAAPSLACTDATSTPNAINLYVTAAGKRTSAPPHTDRQDVVVIQTSGQKHWRVFAPTDSALKPMADIFARGKVDDYMPLHVLLDTSKNNGLPSPGSSELLIDTDLRMGDVLFVPAAFPHTTSTAHTGEDGWNPKLVDNDRNNDDDATSVHLTFNIDTHIWELDYLSARRLALKRSGVQDTALGQTKDSDNRYEGRANQLPPGIRQDLFKSLPMGLLDDNDAALTLLKEATAELKRISFAVDEKTASAVEPSVWEETMVRLRQQGMELLETHRNMYLAALQEGVTREAEDAMTQHLTDSGRRVMTPERMQRLSLFRVKKYYEQIDASKRSLREWASETSTTEHKGPASSRNSKLQADWAFTLPVKVGDQVEADLGGAFFDATVTRVAGNKYDVQFFDGDFDTGLDRSMIKLKTPPPVSDDEDVDTSRMTPKQLKRWRKDQAQKK